MSCRYRLLLVLRIPVFRSCLRYKFSIISCPLQTDTSLALEAKIMKRWEFDSIAQAASCMSSWFSGTLSERQILNAYLDSTIGTCSYIKLFAFCCWCSPAVTCFPWKKHSPSGTDAVDRIWILTSHVYRNYGLWIWILTSHVYRKYGLWISHLHGLCVAVALAVVVLMYTGCVWM